MIRRNFLTILAGSPFVFGLRELLEQEPRQDAPEYFRAALSRMKELDSPGIVLLIPEGQAERDRMAEALYKRLMGDSAQVREIMTGCVVICLPCGVLKPPPDAKEDRSNRILLDPDGNRLAGDTMGIGTLEDPTKFVASFNAMLHGEDGSRLEARARKASGPEAVEALKDLNAEEIAAREKATAVLVREAARIQPLLVHAGRTSDSAEVRARLNAVLERLYQQSAENQPGPRLPFGTKIEVVTEMRGGGGDPCPGCGMSVMVSKQRKFLRFLAK